MLEGEEQRCKEVQQTQNKGAAERRELQLLGHDIGLRAWERYKDSE